MKKLIALLMAMMLLVCAAGCGGETAEPAGPTVEKVTDCTVPPLVVEINGVKVTNQTLGGYPVYSIKSKSVNSSGTEKEYEYIGFALADVLESVGIKDGFTTIDAVASDGYTISCAAETAVLPTTLLAFMRDGEQFKDGPWFAPCSSGTSGDYLKETVAFNVDADVAITPEADTEPEEPAVADDALGLIELQYKDSGFEFAPFSFKVNGKKVTNEKLAGLPVLEIKVRILNSKGETVEAAYTGYSLTDVLGACDAHLFTKVFAIADDDYIATIDPMAVLSTNTLVAIEKDNETGKDGTVWIAPCDSTESKAYIKLIVEIETAG